MDGRGFDELTRKLANGVSRRSILKGLLGGAGAAAAAGIPRIHVGAQDACTPDCTDNACGDDGCGGLCPSVGDCCSDLDCAAGSYCEAGFCVATNVGPSADDDDDDDDECVVDADCGVPPPCASFACVDGVCFRAAPCLQPEVCCELTNTCYDPSSESCCAAGESACGDGCCADGQCSGNGWCCASDRDPCANGCCGPCETCSGGVCVPRTGGDVCFDPDNSFASGVCCEGTCDSSGTVICDGPNGNCCPSNTQCAGNGDCCASDRVVCDFGCCGPCQKCGDGVCETDASLDDSVCFDPANSFAEGICCNGTCDSSGLPACNYCDTTDDCGSEEVCCDNQCLAGDCCVDADCGGVCARGTCQDNQCGFVSLCPPPGLCCPSGDPGGEGDICVEPLSGGCCESSDCTDYANGVCTRDNMCEYPGYLDLKKYYCPGDVNNTEIDVENPVVPSGGDPCEPGAATFEIWPFGVEADAITVSTDPVTGKYLVVLPPGTHAIKEVVSGVSAPFTIVEGQTTTVTVRNFVKDPTGSLYLKKYYCKAKEDGTDIEVEEREVKPAGGEWKDDCHPGKATFEIWPFKVEADKIVVHTGALDGIFMAELPVGTHAIKEVSSGEAAEFTIYEDETTTIVVTNWYTEMHPPKPEHPKPEKPGAEVGGEPVAKLPTTGSGDASGQSAGWMAAAAAGAAAVIAARFLRGEANESTTDS